MEGRGEVGGGGRSEHYLEYLDLIAHGKLHHKCILMYKYMDTYMYVLVQT